MKPQICVMRFQAWVTQGNCVMKHEICVGLVWSRRELCREAPNLCHEDFGPLGRGNCHTSHTGARALMLQISLRERPFCIPPRKPHFGRAPSDILADGLKLRTRFAIGETMPVLDPHEYCVSCDKSDDCKENEHSQITRGNPATPQEHSKDERLLNLYTMPHNRKTHLHLCAETSTYNNRRVSAGCPF